MVHAHKFPLTCKTGTNKRNGPITINKCIRSGKLGGNWKQGLGTYTHAASHPYVWIAQCYAESCRVLTGWCVSRRNQAKKSITCRTLKRKLSNQCSLTTSAPKFKTPSGLDTKRSPCTTTPKPSGSSASSSVPGLSPPSPEAPSPGPARIHSTPPKSRSAAYGQTSSTATTSPC